MKMFDKKALLEALKSFVRLGLIAIVSYLLTEGVVNTLLVAILGASLSPEMRVVLSGVVISALKSLDTWLHEKDIETPLDLKSMDKLI